MKPGFQKTPMPRGTSAGGWKARHSSYHKLPSLPIIERGIAHTHDNLHVSLKLLRQQEFLAIRAAETTFPGRLNSIALHRSATERQIGEITHAAGTQPRWPAPNARLPSAPFP